MPATILIVENHTGLRRALRWWLEAMFPACHIIESASAEEAIVATQANLPKLVIMDTGLPEMNGLEAIPHIKAVVPNTQVVVLTVYEHEADPTGITTDGANAYVPKDRILTELQPVLAELLSSYRDPIGHRRGGVS